MHDLKALLGRAIAHARENEPQPSRTAAVVFFFVQCEIQACRKERDYRGALTAMTLFRLLRQSPNINSLWKSLVAACKDGDGQEPPTPNRGVGLISKETQSPAKPSIDVDTVASSAMSERDRASYDRLTEYLSRG